jgi:hypothetical protein
VHTSRQFIGQKGIHHPMTFDTGLAGKYIGADPDLEMRFTTFAPTCVARMLVADIKNLDLAWRKCLLKLASYGVRHGHVLSPAMGDEVASQRHGVMMEQVMRRPSRPEVKIPGNAETDQRTAGSARLCEAEGCKAEAHYPAPKSRDALRDYIWFCLEHIRAYNKSWNYYEGLQGAALEAEIRRATTWERPSWKFATGKPAEEMFHDPMGLFDFENRSATAPGGRHLSPEERQAWKTLKMEPVNDLSQVKSQYKQLAKEHHPDINGGDAGAEERLKEINLAYDLIRKSLQSAATQTIS